MSRPENSIKTLRIGELGRQFGVGVETIRYYEREGLLLEPPRHWMTCLTCEAHVEKVLSALSGVSSADASTAKANVVVAFDPAITTVQPLVDAIQTQTGYQATLPEETP